MQITIVELKLLDGDVDEDESVASTDALTDALTDDACDGGVNYFDVEKNRCSKLFT